MNKSKVVGLTVTVLAVIGGVAVYNWAKTSKKSPEKFLGADGENNWIKCKRQDGSYYLRPPRFTSCESVGHKLVGYDRPRITKKLEVMDNVQ
jgi:hypothetical protein